VPLDAAGAATALPGGLSASAVTAFFDAGGSVALLTTGAPPRPAVELAAELGVAVASGSTLRDDANAVDGGFWSRRVTALRHLADDVAAAAGLVVGASASPLDVSGAGPAGLAVVRTAGTAEGRGAGGVTCDGGRCVVVAAVQGDWSGARAVVVADALSASDAAWGAGRPGNGALWASLARWLTHRAGVIRAVRPAVRRADGRPADVLHPAREDSGGPPGLFARPETAVDERAFRVGDELVYSVLLQSRGADGAWEPAAVTDAQVELAMLDPHTRSSLAHAGAGVHEAAVRAPAVPGAFTARLSHRRAGLSRVLSELPVTLRPVRHDEFERFLPAAAPHYAAAAAAIALLLLLVTLTLTTADKDKRE